MRTRYSRPISGAIGLVAFLLVLLPSPARAAQPGEIATECAPGQSFAHAYTLPPRKLQQAHALYLWRTGFDFAWPLWSILVLLAILRWRAAARMGAWAASASRRPWLAGLCFAPLFLLLLALLHLPPEMLAHRVSLDYGQSVQGWRSWFLDWCKGLGVDLIAGTAALSALFAIIRASRRWWIWFWILSLPTQFAVAFLLPLAVDPLFNRFVPLAPTNPTLAAKLEEVVAKTGVHIPPARIYLMNASEKVTGSNAYVTGFGSSRRIVVWDTTIKSSPDDEILIVFGHELGHYVLHHIERGLAIASILSFFLLWLGFHLAKAAARRWGAYWGIQSLADWAAAPLLLLTASLLSVAVQPLANAISRSQEHQADIFGQEVVHGIVNRPQCVAARSFRRLGEEALEYPYPSPFVVFWSYSHPPISSRLAFAAAYDPWLPGGRPRYFQKR